MVAITRDNSRILRRPILKQIDAWSSNNLDPSDKKQISLL